MQPVTMISGGMRQEDIVSDNVWFSGWFSHFTKEMAKKRTSSRSLNAQVITLDRETMRFIEGDPVLYSISKSLEAGKGIILEVLSVSEWRLLWSLIGILKYVVYNFVLLTLSVCSATHHIYLQVSVEDPSDIELQKAGFLIENSLTFKNIIPYGKSISNWCFSSDLFPVKNLSDSCSSLFLQD